MVEKLILLNLTVYKFKTCYYYHVMSVKRNLSQNYI